ncbi:hypothetical protein ZIOFF_039947 [Zingiber officinale]|uniref:VQ domain-containing protein n=1 Tax=Zingiber officinale TaxID=94328 RepID=A0A8J5G349_ZINOF|nr:hypothetical protein ZIOFF_039947 [Zingiber officinale]
MEAQAVTVGALAVAQGWEVAMAVLVAMEAAQANLRRLPKLFFGRRPLRADAAQRSTQLPVSFVPCHRHISIIKRRRNRRHPDSTAATNAFPSISATIHAMDPSLGINKQSKQIRKPSPPPPPQQIYNISKNDFRAVVQQLTGSPSRDHLRPQPPPRPRPPSSRLLKIRPPPLSPIAPPPHPNPNLRAPAWASSPVSAYMRYLESTLLGPASSSRHRPPPPFPSPPPLALLSPRLIMSPNSFLSPSPSGYLNLLSPRSPYPLISPGFQYPPPPVFSPLPHPETLGAGTGGHGLPAPPSPGFFFFPQSPSAFLPSRSPRRRD